MGLEMGEGHYLEMKVVGKRVKGGAQMSGFGFGIR